MKTIQILFLMIFLSQVLYSFGQEEGKYYQIPELEKYVGTWEWKSGDTTMIIDFIVNKVNMKEEFGEGNPNAFVDVLFGWHEYSIDNVVKQKSRSNMKKTSSKKNNNYTIVSYYNKEGFVRIVRFTDMPNQTNPSRGFLESTGNENEINIRLVKSNRLLYESKKLKKEPKKYDLPLNMTLHKIE